MKFIFTLVTVFFVLTPHALIANTLLSKAEKAYANEDYKTAFTEYEKVAQQGNAEAQAKLGVMFYWGRGTFRSDSKTYVWSLKAARQGHQQAQHMMGYLFENGIHVEKDINKAIEWYRKSADQGYAPAQANLAGIYMLSEERPKEYQRGFRLAQSAAAKNNKHAEYLMGYYYQYHIEDYRLARKWYTVAAKNGNHEAANLLGIFYFNGLKIKRDIPKAFFWFRIAERNDSAKGFENRERAQRLLKDEEVIELEKEVDQWFADVEKEREKNKKIDPLKAMREILELEDT